MDALSTSATILSGGCCLLAVFVYLNCRAWQRIKTDEDIAERYGRAARNRIPEEDLLDDAWLGGIGGVLAMCRYHHKTSNPELSLHCKNVKVILILAGLPQLNLFRGFYSVHVRVISTLPGYSPVADVSIMAQLANHN